MGCWLSEMSAAFAGTDVVGGGADAGYFFFGTATFEAWSEEVVVSGVEAVRAQSGGFDGGEVAAVVHGVEFALLGPGVVHRR